MNKIEKTIIGRVKEIEDATFDEDAIKLLLIEIRERIKHNSILKEICHFVAHSHRDKGICHSKIDVRYAKFKLVQDQTIKIFTPEFMEENKDKPESFFSNAMLSYIRSDRIEANLFKLIVMVGMEDISESMFNKYYGVKKDYVRSLLKRAYTKHGGFYVLVGGLTIKEYLFIIEILKFIRGTIEFTSVLSANDILDDFLQGVKKLCSSLNYDFNIDKALRSQNDLLVVILCLLHECTFKLFDGTIAKGALSFQKENEELKLCLIVKTDKITFPFIMTDVLSGSYIQKGIAAYNSYFNDIPWIHAVRHKNGQLILNSDIKGYSQ